MPDIKNDRHCKFETDARPVERHKAGAAPCPPTPTAHLCIPLALVQIIMHKSRKPTNRNTPVLSSRKNTGDKFMMKEPRAPRAHLNWVRFSLGWHPNRSLTVSMPLPSHTLNLIRPTRTPQATAARKQKSEEDTTPHE